MNPRGNLRAMQPTVRALASGAALVLSLVGVTHCVASDAQPPGSTGGYGAYGGAGAGNQDASTDGTTDGAGAGGQDASSDGASGGGGTAGAGAGGVGGGGASGGAGTGASGGTSGSGGSSGSGGAGGTGGSGGGGPYRHTIIIDGTNDFNAAAERFTTTSASYDAYVTWDASTLYVGYTGDDIGPTASNTKWLFVYVDVDPGAGTGASTGEKYTSEQPAFPSGFSADYYYAWRTDNQFPQFKHFTGGVWSTVTPSGVTVGSSGSYVEIAIPFSSIGATSSPKLGIVTFMMNEASNQEAAYAGLYTGSFTDGYYPSIPIQYYLLADLGSSANPNASANQKP